MAADEQPDEGRRSVLADALIREGVALAVMVVMVWYMGPGKDWVARMRQQAAALFARRGNWIDAETARFRADVSRWEHEQAAEQDRGTGRSGPCGCGELPPVRHRGHAHDHADGAGGAGRRRRRRRADDAAGHR